VYGRVITGVQIVGELWISKVGFAAFLVKTQA
jgi:hypothetical protein